MLYVFSYFSHHANTKQSIINDDNNVYVKVPKFRIQSKYQRQSQEICFACTDICCTDERTMNALLLCTKSILFNKFNKNQSRFEGLDRCAWPIEYSHFNRLKLYVFVIMYSLKKYYGKKI